MKKPHFHIPRLSSRLRPSYAYAAKVMLPLGAALAMAACSSNTGQAPSGAPQAAPVDVAAAVERSVAGTEELTARLQALETVEIRARVSGPIEKVSVQAGARVQRGQLLFSIDARPYRAELARAQAQLLNAQAQERLAEKELVRAQNLLAAQAGSRQEFEQAGTALETAKASTKLAEAGMAVAQLNLEHTSVRAPVAGRLSRIEATEGNLVNDQRVLTTLLASQKVYAYFDVSEQSYLSLRKAPDATRVVKMGLADENGFPREGKLDFVDNQLNAQSATLRLRAVFDNADGTLLPGLSARVQINASLARNVVFTPERAIGTNQDKKFVYVVGADNKPLPRPVTLGVLLDGMRALETGVKPGELIVVNGLQRIRPGAPVAPNKLATDPRGMPIEEKKGT
jgi:membrane fusion protein, multidrug efflux system